MAFLDIQFPPEISRGAVGGPGYSTDVVEIASGFEQRNQNWSVGRGAWDVSHGVKTQTELDELIAFFRIAKGKANGFRFKDWADFSVTSTTGYLGTTGAGTGGATYQLYKRYANAAGSELRAIAKPVASTFKAYRGGVLLVAGSGDGQYALDAATGILTMVAIGSPTSYPTAGETMRWTGDFDMPVRFDIDRMGIKLEDRGADDVLLSSWGEIPVVEIRV